MSVKIVKTRPADNAVRRIVIRQIFVRYLVDLNIGVAIEESLLYTAVRQSRDQIAIRPFIEDVYVRDIFAKLANRDWKKRRF